MAGVSLDDLEPVCSEAPEASKSSESELVCPEAMSSFAALLCSARSEAKLRRSGDKLDDDDVSLLFCSTRFEAKLRRSGDKLDDDDVSLLLWSTHSEVKLSRCGEKLDDADLSSMRRNLTTHDDLGFSFIATRVRFVATSYLSSSPSS